jgi:hypothetical protein
LLVALANDKPLNRIADANNSPENPSHRDRAPSHAELDPVLRVNTFRPVADRLWKGRIA